jgi:hypothetical protein
LVLGLAAYAELPRGAALRSRAGACAWLAADVRARDRPLCGRHRARAYGRPVNLYWDARHLPNVGAMLAEVAKPWMLVAFLAGWPRSSR